MLNSDASASVDEMAIAAKPCPLNPTRRKLADITNLQPAKPMPPVQNLKPQTIAKSTDEYIEKLRKENESLVKQLTQRNKMIEQREMKLEQLNVALIKLREQNQQFALLHTHMLAELNSGKDRLKVLQHELSCKTALLNLRKPEPEESITSYESSDEAEDEVKPDVRKKRERSQGLSCSTSSHLNGVDANRTVVARRQSARFKATEVKLEEANELDNLSTSDREETKPVGAKTRGSPPKNLCSSEPSNSEKHAGSNRQSLRLKGINVEITEGLIEADDSQLSKCCTSPKDEHVMMEPVTLSQNEAPKVEENTLIGSEAPSFRRPSRLAATKVMSYKERPVNIKMRRE